MPSLRFIGKVAYWRWVTPAAFGRISSIPAAVALPRITLPAAHAARMGIFGQIAVSPFSGSPAISIPLHTVVEFYLAYTGKWTLRAGSRPMSCQLIISDY